MRSTVKLVTKVASIFDRAINLLAFLAAALLIFMMLSVCVEVTTRYFLEQPMPGVIEIAEYTLLYITFLGAAWVLKREGHVKMDIVLNRLNPRAQALVNMITSAIGAIIFLIITWYGIKVTWEHSHIGYFLATYLKPPSFIIVAVIPVGSLLFFIQFLRRTYGFSKNWSAARKEEQIS